MKAIKFFLGIGILLFLSTNMLVAQNYWLGGTPGKETDWNTAKNWSQNKVPDWTQDVIIPNVSTLSNAYPVINTEVEPIPHLEIHNNATLTILEKGSMIIDGMSTYNSGITLVGLLDVLGALIILNTIEADIENQGGTVLIQKELMAKQ